MKASTTINFLLIVLCSHIANADDHQMRVAVYKIKSEVLPEEFTVTLTDHIESKLLNYPVYRVISRSNLDVLITEDNLSFSGVIQDEVRVIKNGSRSAVDKICTGSISRIGRSYSFTLKMIDVESGRIDAATQQIYSGPAEGLLDIGSSLLKKILPIDTTGKDTAESIRTVTKLDSTESIIQTIQPITNNPKEDIPQPTLSKKVPSVPATTDDLSTKRSASTSTNKPSGLGQKISVGAVLVFGALAAIVLLTRNEH